MFARAERSRPAGKEVSALAAVGPLDRPVQATRALLFAHLGELREAADAEAALDYFTRARALAAGGAPGGDRARFYVGVCIRRRMNYHFESD